MDIKNSRELMYLKELYENRTEAQKLYENYVMQNEKLKWYQFNKRKWYKYSIHNMRKIIESWDLLISINTKRLIEVIENEG